MEPSCNVDGLPIWVFDNVLPVHEHDAMFAYCLNSLYSPKHLSNSNIDGPSDSRFVSNLTKQQSDDLSLTHARNEILEHLGYSTVLSHVYINCYDTHTSCASHIDAHFKSLTFLYYANTKWDIDWGGETLFYDSHKNIAFASALRPNRAIVFDARILHMAKVPSVRSQCNKFSISYKGEKQHDSNSF